MALGYGKPTRSVAIIYLIGTAVLWSFGGVLIKLVSLNPLGIAGMRSAMASLLLLAVVRKPSFNWSFSQVGGAVAYAATVTLFVSANKMTTAANAILLQYTAPVYVAILGAWFLKEYPKLLDWITIFFVLGGMTLFFLDKLTPGGLLGNLLAIIGGISFAATALFMRSQKDSSPLESVLLGNILTALIGVPFAFGSKIDTTSWIALALLGVFQLGLSYLLYAAAIKHVTALEAALIPVLEPILNPIWVFLIVGEAPGKWAFIGGIIVLVSVAFRYIKFSGRKD